MKHDCRKYYIGGAWVEPLDARDFPITSPATGEDIGMVALASAACLVRAARPRPSAGLLLPWLAVPACWIAGRALALLLQAS